MLDYQKFLDHFLANILLFAFKPLKEVTNY
jgi:hypothetical protein